MARTRTHRYWLYSPDQWIHHSIHTDRNSRHPHIACQCMDPTRIHQYLRHTAGQRIHRGIRIGRNWNHRYSRRACMDWNCTQSFLWHNNIPNLKIKYCRGLLCFMTDTCIFVGSQYEKRKAIHVHVKILGYTSLTDESVVGCAAVLCPAISSKSTAFRIARFLRQPVPPAHRCAVTPRPRRATRLAFLGWDAGTRTGAGRAIQTNPAFSVGAKPASH